MLRYAVYRVLYGEDFIIESIMSILPVVDKIIIFKDTKPWGDISHVKYNSRVIPVPEQIDNWEIKVRSLHWKYLSKIDIITDHMSNNIGQFTHFVNDIIIPNYGKPDYILFVEPDHVFRKDMAAALLTEMELGEVMVGTTRPIELWRTPLYRIPERPRKCSVLWNMKHFDHIPMTGRHADITNISTLNIFTHNLGFCVSPNSMLWKFLLCIEYSNKINDSPPNPNWYNKWLDWTVIDRDLEISLGHERDIPFAYSYDKDDLPETIVESLNKFTKISKTINDPRLI